MPNPDPNAILFRVEALTCKISTSASDSYQSLHCELTPNENFANHLSKETHLKVKTQPSQL